MKHVLCVLTTLAVCVGCGSRHDGTVDAQTPAVAAAPGTVVIPADSPMLGQIKRAIVATQDLPTDEIVTPGKIEVNPNRVSKVLLPVAGRIVAVLVKTGDGVRKDQPLLSIDSPDADAAMTAFLSAEATVMQARTALAKATADSDRLADLFAHNAVAQKEVLNADSALAQARAALAQAQASQEQGQRRLAVLGLTPGNFKQQVVVTSPLAGKVLDLSVVPGEFRNDTTASVMTIADLSTVWVTSQVPESYIRFVQPGERVEISLVAYPGETFEGRVMRIADTVDPQTRSVKVQAVLKNPDGRFRPEMYGSIHHVESTASMTVVPYAALVQDGERTVVFVERAPGQFVERDVTVGKRAGDVVRIIDGLSPGDSIVVDGAMLLAGLAKRT
jgi:cobalt-zinc-cadmium efflux system membrane fusion protein